jgi:type II secretory pathway pseudopilin PulG
MSESHIRDEDAWSSARDATRDDVRAALRPRAPRTCPECGRVEEGPARTCAGCGGDFVVRRRGPDRRVVLVAVALAVVLAGTAAALVPGLRDDADRDRRAAAAAQERLEAAERARLRAEGRPRTVAGPARRPGEDRLAHRARLVSAGTEAVTADARRRVREGTVDGPVLGTRCSPYPKTGTRAALERDPAVPRGRYQCLAYKRRVSVPALEGRERVAYFGVLYWLVADYGTSRMTFCKITPKAGEGGKSLATVPVAPPCRDPLPAS